jgi:hypothetical protein
MARGPSKGPFNEMTTRAFARRAEPSRPTCPPIQQVASDLRRLNRQLNELPAGASWVRTIGISRAYDQVLALACQQLEVATRLLDLPDGKPRILERIRLEFMLGERGLRI